MKDLPWLRQVFFYGILGGDTQKEGENMNITVYLGANEGNDPALKQAVRELGTWIGESGNDLVYGGSKVGLMGIIAESVLRAGGKVTGVEPQFFMEKEYFLYSLGKESNFL